MIQKLIAFIAGFLALFWRNKAKKAKARAENAEKQVENYKEINELERRMTDIADNQPPIKDEKDEINPNDVFGNANWS